MQYIEYKGTKIELNEYGFIANDKEWTKELAERLAETENIKLTDKHWEVVLYLRNMYTSTGVAPTVKKLCAELNMTLRDVYLLFPAGPSKGAAKIAGLSRPAGCS